MKYFAHNFQILRTNQEFDSFIRVLTVFSSVLTPPAQLYWPRSRRIRLGQPSNVSQQGTFQPGSEGSISPLKVIKHQNSDALPPGEAEKSPSLGIFQLQAATALSKATKPQSWARLNDLQRSLPFIQCFYSTSQFHGKVRGGVGGNSFLSKYSAALRQCDSKGQVISWGKERNVTAYFRYRPLQLHSWLIFTKTRS